MANTSIIQKMMGFSPQIEMMIRRLYRIKFINKLLSKKKLRKNKVIEKSYDFSNIISYLRDIGIKQGDILIVHSAFKPLKPSGLTPEQIIDKLLELVGPNGTLVMPVIRAYPYYDVDNKNKYDLNKDIFTYDVKKSKVWTGIIPKLMMERKEAVTSRFPLNSITAIGSEATKMMEKELLEERPAPNGVNSSWKYCTDKNAWVVSLGTDLTHSLTIIHTVEDVKKDEWPVKNWYREVAFEIIDEDFKTTKTVLERHPRWGTMHFGERKLCSDLIENNIMTTKYIDGVLIESLRAKPLYDFMNSKNEKGYPYFWLNKHLK